MCFVERRKSVSAAHVMCATWNRRWQDERGWKIEMKCRNDPNEAEHHICHLVAWPLQPHWFDSHSKWPIMEWIVHQRSELLQCAKWSACTPSRLESNRWKDISHISASFVLCALAIFEMHRALSHRNPYTRSHRAPCGTDINSVWHRWIPCRCAHRINNHEDE